MSRVIGFGPNTTPFTTVIRCAQSYNGRVNGCFAQIEIELSDIQASRDFEGDWTITAVCPNCKTNLHLWWQLPPHVIEEVKRNFLNQ